MTTDRWGKAVWVTAVSIWYLQMAWLSIAKKTWMNLPLTQFSFPSKSGNQRVLWPASVPQWWSPPSVWMLGGANARCSGVPGKWIGQGKAEKRMCWDNCGKFHLDNCGKFHLHLHECTYVHVLLYSLWCSRLNLHSVHHSILYLFYISQSYWVDEAQKHSA